MRIRINFPILIGFALFMAASLTMPAKAQQAGSTVLSGGCGTASYTAGKIYPTTQDTTGRQCGASSSSGGAVTATIAPATKVSTTVLAANLVVDATAGHLTSFDVSADSTLSASAWWVIIYDATTAPGDGTVTPAKCYAMPLGATSISAAFPIPVTFTTGITIGVSTTGCFAKTASTHAFISGDFQ